MFTNREGTAALIVQKGDGGWLRTTDLAAMRYRIEACRPHPVRGRFAADRAPVDGAAVSRQAGWLTDATEVDHVAFGSVLGEDNKVMKSRAGVSLLLADLLDEAVERAAAIIEEKNPDLDEAERAEVARAVGIGAIKYADLSSDRTRDYTFSFDRMLAFEGNTAPYLQYVVARVRSILRKARAEGVAVPGENGAVLPGIVGVDEPAERALALALVAFERVVADTARSAQPHRLCTYLFELAQAFTRFYEAAPILKAATEAQRHDRLALAIGTERVMCAARLAGYPHPSGCNCDSRVGGARRVTRNRRLPAQHRRWSSIGACAATLAVSLWGGGTCWWPVPPSTASAWHFSSCGWPPSPRSS